MSVVNDRQKDQKASIEELEALIEIISSSGDLELQRRVNEKVEQLIKDSKDLAKSLLANPSEVEQALIAMRLRSGTKRYDIFKWVLEHLYVPFTVEDVLRDIGKSAGIYDYLHHTHSGRSEPIPGFILTVVNKGHNPVIYRLIRSSKK